MLIITYVIIAIILYCWNIFLSIIDGKDNPNEYEINWFHAIKTIDDYYSGLDELDEGKKDIEYKKIQFDKYQNKEINNLDLITTYFKKIP